MVKSPVSKPQACSPALAVAGTHRCQGGLQHGLLGCEQIRGEIEAGGVGLSHRQSMSGKRLQYGFKTAWNDVEILIRKP